MLFVPIALSSSSAVTTERFLREKSGCHEGNLDIHFYTEFGEAVPHVDDGLGEEVLAQLQKWSPPPGNLSASEPQGGYHAACVDLVLSLPGTPATINSDPKN